MTTDPTLRRFLSLFQRPTSEIRHAALAVLATCGLLVIAGLMLGNAADTPKSPDSAPRDGGPLPFSYLRGEPMRIGNEIQFLMDDYMVEDRWKMTRRVGPVVKHLRNPVIVQDQPWEDAAGAYPSVLYDEKIH